MLAWAVEAAGRTAEATGAASMAMFIDRARVVLGSKGPTLRCQSALPRLMLQVRWSAKSGLICTSAAGPASWDSSQRLTSGPLYQGTPCLPSSRLLFCFRLARRINSSALPVLAPPVRRQAACMQAGGPGSAEQHWGGWQAGFLLPCCSQVHPRVKKQRP